MSDKNVANASLVGAKTVNGPSPWSTVTKSPFAAVSAATNDVRSGVSSAISTIFWGWVVTVLSSSLLHESVVNNNVNTKLIFFGLNV